ncbi:MAG TPA: MFS transporter [Xanthobacteraceae bacterium]|nr:MFS transporter [Xanthobacteraceae bacterium]
MTSSTNLSRKTKSGEAESSYAWLRLLACLGIGTAGSVGLWSYVVALPAVQAEFGVVRAEASLPYTATMIGFGIGAVLLGRISDRFSIVAATVSGAILIGIGYVVSGFAPNLFVLALASVVLGMGSSASFAPLMADISHWFTRRRGAAVTIVASGNYLSGTLWPALIQHSIAANGWRMTYFAIGAACFAVMLPLSMVLRRRIALHAEDADNRAARGARNSLGISQSALMALICLAGVACCVAMSMPQVHIVAYCGDLGYGAARGAEMLSLMLGFGVVSRAASGFIADKIGGVETLVLSSSLQGIALFLYLFFDHLTSLYVISALFGLFQGGIVPMYAILVRQYFPAKEAGTRVGLAISATIVGMAFGGWISGWIFDHTGSYHAAFMNGLIWNLVNISIVAWLLFRTRTHAPRLARA